MDLSSLVLSHLADSSVRALALAAVVLAALWLGRVRSVSVRHAACALTLGCMLLLPCVTNLLPDLPLRILPARQPAPLSQEALTSGKVVTLMRGAVVAGGQRGYARPNWQQVGLALYGSGLLVMLGRLLLSCLLVRRLVRSCVPASDARASALLERHGGGCPPALVESSGILVPLTTGSFTSRILLPADWRAWDDAKLEASLVHEISHVRRRDPLIALMAALNTCIFWFHPLAWWLERRLALLAEQAADDSTILAVRDRCGYASTLLDMASAAGERRLQWGAVAMARPSQLRQRIDRVLDESARLSHGLTRGRWLALSLASAVVLCGVAALRLEAVPAPSGAYSRWLEEDVVYIISDEERSAFLRLTTAEEQEAFIEQFWLRRDPTPGTARNEYKEEHYRRIAYANERYAAGIPGWKLDRGRVYITFGPPDENEAHPTGDEARPPYEIWRYGWIEGVGWDVDLEFTDTLGTGEYRLTDARMARRTR